MTDSIYDLIERESLDITVASVQKEIRFLCDLVKERQEKEYENPEIDENSNETDRNKWGKRMRLLSEIGVQAEALSLRCDKIAGLLSLVKEL